MDPRPPVSSARSKTVDVAPGRFASLPSAPQAQRGLPGSSHPRPRADPGNGASGGGALWVISAQGSHRTPWCGQRGGLSSVRSCPLVPTTWPPPGCPVTHPHPQAAHSTALVPGSPGTHPDAQQFSLISFLLWFGRPLVGTAHGMAPSTYQVPTEKLPSGQKGFFLTPTFEFSAFSDFCVIRIKKKRLFTLNRRQIVCVVIVYLSRKKYKLPKISPPTCPPGV